MSEDESHAIIGDLVDRYASVRGGLLPLLHAILEEIGYIPDRAVAIIAGGLNISRADVHGVVTFYSDFRRTPAGRHVVKICRAEACQARGGGAIEKMAVERLGVAMGETRRDGQVTLEAVYCLGMCASGPNALIDGHPLSRIDASKINRIAQMVQA